MSPIDGGGPAPSGHEVQVEAGAACELTGGLVGWWAGKLVGERASEEALSWLVMSCVSLCRVQAFPNVWHARTGDRYCVRFDGTGRAGQGRGEQGSLAGPEGSRSQKLRLLKPKTPSPNLGPHLA